MSFNMCKEMVLGAWMSRSEGQAGLTGQGGLRAACLILCPVVPLHCHSSVSEAVSPPVETYLWSLRNSVPQS